MIRIYEGVDGSGKSTKALEDAKKWSCKYVHNPVDWRDPNPYKAWKKFFKEYKGKDICIDRSFIGNPIYHDWFGDDADFTPEQIDKLCREDFVLIYCETGTEYEDAVKRGEDNLKKKRDYIYIKDAYHEFINWLIEKHNKTVFRYNWRTKEFESITKID